MLSLDTNILLYGVNQDCPEFPVARKLIEELGRSEEVILCELVLVELYLLVRNPAVVQHPLSAPSAAALCQRFRANPCWQLVESAPVMADVWQRAAAPGFARRRIIDARLALTLRQHGVTELITRNTGDFQDFGFERIWHPF